MSVFPLKGILRGNQETNLTITFSPQVSVSVCPCLSVWVYNWVFFSLRWSVQLFSTFLLICFVLLSISSSNYLICTSASVFVHKQIQHCVKLNYFIKFQEIDFYRFKLRVSVYPVGGKTKRVIGKVIFNFKIFRFLKNIRIDVSSFVHFNFFWSAYFCIYFYLFLIIFSDARQPGDTEQPEVLQTVTVRSHRAASLFNLYLISYLIFNYSLLFLDDLFYRSFLCWVIFWCFCLLKELLSIYLFIYLYVYTTYLFSMIIDLFIHISSIFRFTKI